MAANGNEIRKTILSTALVCALLASAGCHDGAPASPSTAATGKPATQPPVVSQSPVDRPKPVKPVVLPTDDAPTHNGDNTAAAPTAVAQVKNTAPSPGLPVYRPDDRRPRHDDNRLKQLGILRYESKHLVLYTDIDPELAKSLPALIDRAYTAWEAYLGKLPPDRKRKPFQMTGYLMKDKELYRRTGLLPDDLPRFYNGRHRGAEFWMNDQTHDYYRRHLMIHEATHCYMTIMPDTRAPPWYLEGMAEQFGTHHVEADGTVRFRVMPHRKQEFVGLGRITLIEMDRDADRSMPFDEVTRLAGNDYLKNEAYAWSWALCEFLGKHPRYRDRFRTLSQHVTGTQFIKTFRRIFAGDLADIRAEWNLFAHDIQHGYDIERAAIEFRAGLPLSAERPEVRKEISASRGWQAGGVFVEKGRRYRVRASGRFTLAREPKPWISEPQGVSIRYWNGRPLGLLLATVHTRTDGGGPAASHEYREIPIGSGAEFVAPVSGTVYFRVNDSWSELADNDGTLTTTVTLINGSDD